MCCPRDSAPFGRSATDFESGASAIPPLGPAAVNVIVAAQRKGPLITEPVFLVPATRCKSTWEFGIYEGSLTRHSPRLHSPLPNSFDLHLEPTPGHHDLSLLNGLEYLGIHPQLLLIERHTPSANLH